MKDLMKEDIEKIVIDTIDIYVALHGVNVDLKSITKAIHERYGYDSEIVQNEVNFIYKTKYTKKEYGVFIGRCQPFHLGHQAILNEIMLDGKKPIIILGSSDKKDERNPLSFKERKYLINKVYNDNEVIIIEQPDNEDWDTWVEEIIETLSSISEIDNVTLYHHNKECDNCSFEFNGKKYVNEHYTKVFEGILRSKPIEFIYVDGFEIDSNGRDIRKNLEKYKHFVDARVYWELKRKGW